MSEKTTLSTAIERAIEESVHMLVRHGATDEEIAEHVVSERKRFSEWQAEVLQQMGALPDAHGGTSGGLQ